ncbi:MAG: low molecular weight phosphotyrosine protein phosphatase [Capsulimonadaceae bacterium]|nr:low molecular weight phosphotyrosine protein phosphatase [Capsulimonadaceae bacterium]
MFETIPTDPGTPIRILFVCRANICRSPLAEAIFTSRVAAAGLSEQIVTGSAGVALWHIGSPPHSRVLAMLSANGIEYAHTARLFGPADLSSWDYLLAMDNDVLRSIWAVGRASAKVQPFVKYAPNRKVDEIPDPMKTGEFSQVYDLISSSCDALLASLRRQYQL